jgi:LacI family transcriptional regulator
MPVTIKQVAEAAGVSIGTASMVLNDKAPLHREKTRQKVLEAARQLGYRPNSFRWALRTGRFNAIGMLVGTRSNTSTLFDDFWAIQEELRAREQHLIVASIEDDKLTNPRQLPRILREWCVDGLLIKYSAHIPARMIELVRESRVPAVWLNSQQPADCVFPDDLEASREAGRRLLALRHRRVGYLSFVKEGHYSVRDRAEGCQQVWRDAGLTPRMVMVESQPNTALQATERGALARKLLAGPDRVTAVVTYEADEALSVYQAALQLGLRVPQDLSIVTFSPRPVVLGAFVITTCVIPFWAVGQISARMLMEKIAKPKSKPSPPRAVPLQFDEGHSIGAQQALSLEN